MDIVEREPGDRQQLSERIRREKNASRRDRYRAVWLALEGRDAPTIAAKLGRSRRRVQGWVYAYRDGGLEALHPKPRPGRPTKLPRPHEAKLKARLEAGPCEDDGVCTLRGEDIRRILEREFGVVYSLNGVYDLLARLGYSCLAPRPRHEKADPKAQTQFREQSPLLSKR